MKLFAAIALAAALSQTFVAADLVSVEGDGTFNIKGPVCSGLGTIATPLGSACPQIGDTAESDCHSYNPSFDAKSGKCVAPVSSLCKPVKGGVWGCVWDLSSVAPAPAPAKTPITECTGVSVEGDSTFCIAGPVCSGSSKTPVGDACPEIGDASVADCHPYVPSYDAKTGKCVAPVPALCKPVKTGVWGCVWNLSGVAPTPAASTLAPASDLAEVEVVDDGTFLVKSPACGGPAATQTGKSCPVVGDVAASGCNSTNPSFDKASGKCVAPVPALCQPTQNNTVWGCVWDLSNVKATSVSAVATTSADTEDSNGGSSGVLIGSFVGVAAVIAMVAAVITSKRKATDSSVAIAADASVLEASPQSTTSQSFRQV